MGAHTQTQVCTHTYACTIWYQLSVKTFWSISCDWGQVGDARDTEIKQALSLSMRSMLAEKRETDTQVHRPQKCLESMMPGEGKLFFQVKPTVLLH